MCTSYDRHGYYLKMSSIKKGSCFCKTFNCRGALQTAKKKRRHHDIDLLQEKSHTTESHMVNTSDVFENITSLYNIIHGKNKVNLNLYLKTANGARLLSHLLC